VADHAYIPRAGLPAATRRYTAGDKQARTRVRLMCSTESRPTLQWSRYEATYRMGCTPSPCGYIPNENGGCPGRTRLYAQDAISSRGPGEDTCKNTHASTKKLAPGVMVGFILLNALNVWVTCPLAAFLLAMLTGHVPSCVLLHLLVSFFRNCRLLRGKCQNEICLKLGDDYCLMTSR
jgi:hypothetical protein